MKTEITLKAWSAYLPYGLHVSTQFGIDVPKDGKIYEIIGLSQKIDNLFNNGEKSFFFEMAEEYEKEFPNSYFNFKPILRDLAALTSEIEHEGEKFDPIDKLFQLCECENEEDFLSAICDDWASANEKIQFAPQTIFSKLLEWKFNVFQIPDKLIVKVTEDFNPYK